MKKILAAAALLIGVPADAAFIVNGSFEAPSVGVSFYSAGSTAITGFTVVALPGGGDVQLTNNTAFGGIGAVASDGAQFLDLTGNIGRGGGVRTDAFQTVAGQTYTAAFDVGAFYIAGFGSYGNATVDLYVNGVYAQSFTKIQTRTTPGTDYGRFSYDFVGAGGATTLAFYSSLSTSSSNLGVAFDNLTVTTAVAGVPEPATWVMMIVGFGALGFGMRRRPNATARIRYA